MPTGRQLLPTLHMLWHLEVVLVLVDNHHKPGWSWGSKYQVSLQFKNWSLWLRNETLVSWRAIVGLHLMWVRCFVSLWYLTVLLGLWETVVIYLLSCKTAWVTCLLFHKLHITCFLLVVRSLIWLNTKSIWFLSLLLIIKCYFCGQIRIRTLIWVSVLVNGWLLTWTLLILHLVHAICEIRCIWDSHGVSTSHLWHFVVLVHHELVLLAIWTWAHKSRVSIFISVLHGKEGAVLRKHHLVLLWEHTLAVLELMGLGLWSSILS